MSDAERLSPQEYIQQIKSEIFGRFAAILYDGKYCPETNGEPAELCGIVPELGDMAVCSMNANEREAPQEIRITWCRPEINRHADLWLTPTDIDVEYGEWDENHDPYIIRDREPIHPEALMELHQAIMNSPT